MSGPDQPGDEGTPLGEPSFDDPAFDDPAFDEVRRLLADARATDPLPPEVAARLDDTLASLRADRAGTAASGERVVVPLRRRFLPMLAAAAAVVVVAAGGIGIAQVVGHGSTSSDSSASSDAGGSSASGVAPTSPEAVVPSTQSKSLAGAAQLPRLSSGAFAQDAAQVMRTLAAVGQAQTGDFDAKTPAPDTTDLSGSVPAPPVTSAPPELRASAGASSAGCTGPEAPDAVTVPARLDGHPVALVFRPPSATAQQVEAWSCDGSALLASASVPR